MRNDAGWSNTAGADLPGAAKCAVFYGRGGAVGCTDGTLAWVSLEEGAGDAVVLSSADSALSRMGTDGERIVVGRNDGVLTLVEGGSSREIYSENDRLRGAVLAELDPDAPGLEAATAGYSGLITVLFEEPDGWRAEHVFQDTDRFHHLAAGELDEGGLGLELVGCGYSGVVTMVKRVAD